MNFNPDPVNKPKKFYSVENYVKCLILSCFLTVQTFHKHILKNILGWC